MREGEKDKDEEEADRKRGGEGQRKKKGGIKKEKESIERLPEMDFFLDFSSSKASSEIY